MDLESGTTMINSMTGFGSAEGQLDGVMYIVEIKTVNNRYFKSRIKLPEMVAFLEDEIEKLLKRNLSRGTINYTLRLKNLSSNILFDIDEAALQIYIKKLEQATARSENKYPIDISSLLNLPGVLVPAIPEAKQGEQIKEKVLAITLEAIDKLKQMRAAEGASIDEDLQTNCDAIKQVLERIQGRVSVVIQEYHDKLKKRIDGLLASAKLKLDEETLAREVAVFAERSDISEEISRLQSHIKQFTDSCKGNEQAGRRLDFISQEMLREANTIASKASNTEIVNWVVDMKCRIDRIKEQVQNVE